MAGGWFDRCGVCFRDGCTRRLCGEPTTAAHIKKHSDRGYDSVGVLLVGGGGVGVGVGVGVGLALAACCRCGHIQTDTEYRDRVNQSIFARD